MAIVSGITGATNWSAIGFDENAVNQNLDEFNDRFNQVASADGNLTTFNDTTIKVSLFGGLGTLTIKGFGFTGTNPTIKSIVWDNGDDGLTIKCSIKLNINTGSISGKITSFTFEVDGFSVSASGSISLQSDGDIVGSLSRLTWSDNGDAYALSGSFAFDPFGTVDGTVTGFAVKLANGSSIAISGVSIALNDLDTVLTVGDLLAMLPDELVGDDVISLTTNGTALLDGGLGNDTYIVTSAAQTLAEQASQGTDSIQLKYNVAVNTEIDLATFANTENLRVFGTGLFDLVGTAADNILVGNAQANSIEGGGGNDVLSGLTGNDTLDGGAGVDTMTGSLGNDVYVVDDIGDVVVEKLDQGTDTVQSSVTRALGAHQERLVLTGSDAIDGTGNGMSNWLTGNAGVNALSGMAGNDVYWVQTAGDTVVEAAAGGTDTVVSSVDFTLGANVERLMLDGVAGLRGTGNTMANRITGTTGNDTIEGGAGIDTMLGGAGDDTYIVDRANDVITEGALMGEDLVQSPVSFVLGANLENLELTGSLDARATGNTLGNDLTGNTGNNVLLGGAGTDSLSGGDGNDLLNGGAHNDTMTGGAGNDAFYFSTAFNAANVETITDFTSGQDLLRFDNDVFTKLGPVGLMQAFRFASGPGETLADAAGEWLIYDTTTGDLYYDFNGTLAGGSVKIATLSGAPALAATDIFVIE